MHRAITGGAGGGGKGSASGESGHVPCYSTAIPPCVILTEEEEEGFEDSRPKRQRIFERADQVNKRTRTLRLAQSDLTLVLYDRIINVMSSYLLGVNALPTALHPTDRERSQNPVIGGIGPWQTSHLSQAPCKLQTGFGLCGPGRHKIHLCDHKSKLTEDTTLAYGTSWEIYTVYIHPALYTHPTQPVNKRRELPFH